MHDQHLYILGLVILVVIVVILFSYKETFSDEIMVGETETTRAVLGNYTTNVRKLHGNSGETIIMVHNSPFTQEVWTPLFMHAQQHRKTEKIPTIISYDVMGYGSGWVPIDPQYNDANVNNKAWELDIFVDQLYNLHRQYAPNTPVTLVGYGFGGTIAQLYALKHPETIKKLVIMMATIGPTRTGVPSEISYLVNWIAQNPRPSYLTIEQSFVQHNLCKWFDNNDMLECPSSENRTDPGQEIDTNAFLIASMLFRQTNCQVYLQIDKIIATNNLLESWNAAKLSFPIVFLAGTRDVYMDIDKLKQDMKLVEKATDNTVDLVTVDGKHGYPIANPKYVYNLITGQK